jgi:predicted lipoprotein with Yx(FWY)xxD motif
MHRSARLALAGAPMLLIALSACGGGGGGLYGSSGSSSQSGSHSPAASAGLRVGHTSLGNVLVDGRGMTVYMLTSDKPNKSLCDATCLTYWPPVAVVPKGGAKGVTATVASTATTTGGKIATVGGWPVYTYVQDSAPGDVTGEGVKSFGGVWYAISPSGQPVKGSSSGSGGSSGGGSGGNSGYGGRY